MINIQKFTAMTKLFYEGGPLFMGILTIVFLVLIVVSVYAFINKQKTAEKEKNLSLIRGVGLFALVTGILGQLIGLYEAFSAIQQVGDVSPAMLASGLRVSMITTLYGMVIFIFSLLIWFAFSFQSPKNK